MEAFTFDTTEQILLAATGTLFIIQALYYLCLYNRIHLRSRAVKRGNVHFSQELPPVSVIICAREECENLRRNLKAVLEQDYPQFEVIVINDGNTDESEDYLTLLEEKYPHLYHSFVPDSSRYISRKKLAATLGVKASKYDWLVFTEANCCPQSNQWLRLLARNFTSRTQVVLGYSGYERGKGWLHKRVAFDNLFTSMRYLGFALAGSPYMGIGRNLAYRKELFYEHKGFSAHLNLQRGDDDLFVNHVVTAENTRVETDADATVRMQPVFRAKDWREEKIGYRPPLSRHATLACRSGNHYPPRVLCRMDGYARNSHTAFPLAGGRHCIPRLDTPVYPASHHRQQDCQGFERPAQILLVAARVRCTPAAAISPLEALLSV